MTTTADVMVTAAYCPLKNSWFRGCEEVAHTKNLKYEGTVPLWRYLRKMCCPTFFPPIPSAGLSFLPVARSSHLKVQKPNLAEKSQRRQEHCSNVAKQEGVE